MISRIFVSHGFEIGSPFAGIRLSFAAMSAEYRQLLDATIAHLERLQGRGVRFLPASPEARATLKPSVPASGARLSPVVARPNFQSPSAPERSVPVSPPVEVSRPPVVAPAVVARPALGPEEKAAAYGELRQRALACVKCPNLVRSRQQVVFGVGNPDTELMFVGEAPGADEDRQGEPFVGAAGQLLTKIIQAMGCQRGEVYIANILKCRPDTPGQSAGNRKPTPAGVFPMIGKIGDVLIGPPNHHSYAARLHEIHNAQFSGMSFDRFKEKVQTVRDEELIARWKLECSKKTVYRLKDAPEGEVKDFTLAQTEEFIRTRIADVEIEEVTRAVLPSALARKIKDYNLIRMVREAWERESRFPMSVSFALRAAFRHLHLQTFKAGRNINFVTSVKPDPINPEKTVKHIRAVLEYLAAHPGSTRDKMVEELRPGAEKDSEAVREILNPLRWLIEKGHIIEFFNGTLAVPSHRQRR